MTYDAPFVLIGVSVACLATGGLLAFGRSRWAPAPALLAAASFGNTVWYWAFSYAKRPQHGAGTWDDEHRYALAVVERADAALSYLPWALLPLAFGIGALGLARAAGKGTTFLGPLGAILAAIPALVLAWWALVAPRLIVPVDSPRWDWGDYLQESALANSKEFACLSLSRAVTTPRRRSELLAAVPRKDVDDAVARCRAVCSAPVEVGFLEKPCAIFAGKLD